MNPARTARVAEYDIDPPDDVNGRGLAEEDAR